MRRLAAAIAAVVLGSGSVAVAGGVAEPAEPVSVFLVRHAEKAADDPRDPGLTEAGRRRASELARLLSAVGVTHLYSSEYERARATLVPLAERHGIEIATVPARDAASQIRALRELPAGSVAVVAGHSNTIPGLVCDLGGRPPDLDCSADGRQLDESDYDRLFVVVLPSAVDSPAPGHALSLRFGD